MKKMGKLQEEVERQIEVIFELLKQDIDDYDDEHQRLSAIVEEKEAENRSLKDEIQEMNNYIYQLHMQKVEMKAHVEISKQYAEKKLEELQNVVDKQMLEIEDLGEQRMKMISLFGLLGVLVVYIVAFLCSCFILCLSILTL